MGPRAAASMALAAALLTQPASPARASACSADTFVIDSVAVSVTICAARSTAAMPHGRTARPPDELRETLSAKGHPSLERTVHYETAASDETARTLDDIPLQALGIERTMHVTLAVHDGSARLEHALLVPGATPLK